MFYNPEGAAGRKMKPVQRAGGDAYELKEDSLNV